MGLAHCPLCLGLAVLSAVRFSAHALMLWQLRPAPSPSRAPATGNAAAAPQAPGLQLA